MTPFLNELPWCDFLARPAFEAPPTQDLNAVCNGPVLVTGAGGSIGSALALHLGRLDLPALVLLESAEKPLYELDRALADDAEVAPHTAAPPTLILGNAGDRRAMEHLFDIHRPRVVFHAAAHKHVPLLEAQPLAAIENNIFVTETITAVAEMYGARVVLLSTDKAVEPASVMGATKHVAEEIVLSAGGTVLRLGNVLGSSGSVTEVFAQQIARGGPLTITDPAARRYFLTLDEAVNLLLFAAMHSGAAALLAPRLPAMHEIVELARFMASQLARGREIQIDFTGLRPGDKLSEQLWSESDVVCSDGIDDRMVSIQSNGLTRTQLESGLAALHSAVEAHDRCEALTQLCSLVPDFRPSKSVLALTRRSGTRACV